MNSESGQKCSLEELKRKNMEPVTPQETHPTPREWMRMLELLEKLEQHTAAQTALLRTLSGMVGMSPTQAQTEALSRDVGQIRAMLQQAGKPREKCFSPLRLHLPHIPWRGLLLGLTVLLAGGGVLWAVWSNLEKLWNLLLPILA